MLADYFLSRAYAVAIVRSLRLISPKGVTNIRSFYLAPVVQSCYYSCKDGLLLLLNALPQRPLLALEVHLP